MKTSLKPVIAFYYSIYVVTLIIAAIGSYCMPTSPWVTVGTSIVQVIYTFLVIYLLASIPLSLKWLYSNIKKIKVLTDEDEKIKRYKRVYYIVLSIIAFGLLASLICFYLFKTQSYIYMAGIEVITLFFCKPTTNKMNTDLQAEATDEPTSETDTKPESDNNNNDSENNQSANTQNDKL